VDAVRRLLDLFVFAFFVDDEVELVDSLEDDSDVDLVRQVKVVAA